MGHQRTKEPTPSGTLIRLPSTIVHRHPSYKILAKLEITCQAHNGARAFFQSQIELGTFYSNVISRIQRGLNPSKHLTRCLEMYAFAQHPNVGFPIHPPYGIYRSDPKQLVACLMICHAYLIKSDEILFMTIKNCLWHPAISQQKPCQSCKDRLQWHPLTHCENTYIFSRHGSNMNIKKLKKSSLNLSINTLSKINCGYAEVNSLAASFTISSYGLLQHHRFWLCSLSHNEEIVRKEKVCH